MEHSCWFRAAFFPCRVGGTLSNLTSWFLCIAVSTVHCKFLEYINARLHTCPQHLLTKLTKCPPKCKWWRWRCFLGFFFCSAIVVHECFRSPHPLHESPGYFVSFYFFRHDLHSTCSKRRPPDCLFSFALKVSTVITMATVEGSGLLSIITVFLWMCK